MLNLSITKSHCFWIADLQPRGICYQRSCVLYTSLLLLLASIVIYITHAISGLDSCINDLGLYHKHELISIRHGRKLKQRLYFWSLEMDT